MASACKVMFGTASVTKGTFGMAILWRGRPREDGDEPQRAALVLETLLAVVRERPEAATAASLTLGAIRPASSAFQAEG